ncbi:ATPase domain-containing protein [Thermococcus sp.]|uniref:ATPase domain-containing protein n=1 Tax=Thermococcus sp. TaxID=35749 RepID=UPI0025CFF87A|nr:ATPase domain-containing protein [Thermococcus sp.]
MLLKITIPNDELHRRLGGGIPAGSIVLIEGDRGTGKSILCQRLLYGFLKNEYSVTYISSQYTTPEFINQMESLSYDIIRELIKRRLQFVSLYPLLVNVSERRKFLSRLVSEPRIWKTDVVIIDTISSLLPKELEESEIKSLSSHLKRLSSIGKVVILTVNPDEINKGVLGVLEEISSVLIRLSVKTFGGDLKNSATVVKYNNAQGVFQKIIPFRVEPGVGFIVEIASVV